MTTYKTQCPKCDKGPLRLKRCIVHYSRGPELESDGFLIADGKTSGTEDEVFKCNACGAEHTISDLIAREWPYKVTYTKTAVKFVHGASASDARQAVGEGVQNVELDVRAAIVEVIDRETDAYAEPPSLYTIEEYTEHRPGVYNVQRRGYKIGTLNVSAEGLSFDVFATIFHDGAEARINRELMELHKEYKKHHKEYKK